MRRALLVLAVGVMWLAHQDLWFWRTAHPLVFGVLPIGLFYHACYTLACVLLMAALTKWAWPSHLEGEDREGPR